jgi:prepilin-type N-terminal cleavage/methylation domain-containing protein
MASNLSRRPGLTLIELLAVVAIIAVLIGLTMAAVQQAREAAARTDCLNRLRQQGLAVLSYESAHGRLPPGAVQGPFPPLGIPDGVSHSLWPFVLPHLEQVPVALAYRVNLPFDHPDNQAAATTPLVVLTCPSGAPDRIEEWDPPPRHGAVADYAPVEVNPFLADIALIDPATSFEGALPVNGRVRLADITDGTSTTLLLVEAGGRPGVGWSSPLLPVGLRQVFGEQFHRHGTPACMADGSVHFLGDTIGLRVLARFATRSGDEVINPGDF